MKKFKSKRKIYALIFIVTVVLIAIGYAVLSTSLNIIGNTTVKKNTWDVHFENFAPTPGSVTATSAGIDGSKTTVNYTVTLSLPGDFYEFSVDVVNEGSIDAMISTIGKSGLTPVQEKYTAYSVAYSDGTPIEVKQKLDAETGKETIKVRVEYKKDVSTSDLPGTDQVLNLTFSLTYVQANSTAVPVVHSVCKRATTLHTETCSRTDAQGCKAVAGDTETITYGSLGTTGTLAAGDAFDCDVNGDKIYDASTERFYYLKDLDTNSNYAMLIYYNNVTGGVPDNASKYEYDSANRPKENGPITAKLQLPTILQWKNVSLYNSTREIKDEGGSGYIDFDYSGYAARLLTYQELVSVCGAGTPTTTGYLDTCKYLVENTKYSSNVPIFGYWLESPNSSNATYVWILSGNTRYIMLTYAANVYNNGVRPVIEVEKSKINY